MPSDRSHILEARLPERSTVFTDPDFTAAKAKELEALANHYAAALPLRPRPLPPRPADAAGEVALVTGTTGNFGSSLLEALLAKDDVVRVYALNRAGTNAPERQRAAFQERDLDEGLLDDAARLRFLDVDFAAPRFGLDQAVLDEVSFGAPLASFRVFLDALRTLVDIALACPFAESPKVQFVSSIGVVINHPGPPPVGETPLDATSALGSGYSESKWVAERMLLSVAVQTALPVQVVRVGQLCGDRDGRWSENEWFALVARAARFTGCLPDLDGDAAFLYNHVAAAALLEIRTAPAQVLHLVHPKPISLRALLAVAARELDVPRVPFFEWFSRLSTVGAAATTEGGARGALSVVRSNPALGLLGFFGAPGSVGRDGAMASYVPLSTEEAVSASATLRALTPLDASVAVQWVAGWRASGFLQEG
ncbi:uncharacterized protein BXZ73DRAFT_73198 [Epithele typhae]|uniref:uncharacterized protein n=1 Tax=Epithele typhae TaxID=378194 RepID=UPI0020088CD8|nr:uncharacterized protein BXZ73DRAFT_73198 [Epithele typhae]KAH9944953.1 hypothetical protein BXZ73DRAFT_73198 [Epithele typhae]